MFCDGCEMEGTWHLAERGIRRREQDNSEGGLISWLCLAVDR